MSFHRHFMRKFYSFKAPFQAVMIHRRHHHHQVVNEDDDDNCRNFYARRPRPFSIFFIVFMKVLVPCKAGVSRIIRFESTSHFA